MQSQQILVWHEAGRRNMVLTPWQIPHKFRLREPQLQRSYLPIKLRNGICHRCYRLWQLIVRALLKSTTTKVENHPYTNYDLKLFGKLTSFIGWTISPQPDDIAVNQKGYSKSMLMGAERCQYNSPERCRPNTCLWEWSIAEYRRV